MSSTSQKSGVVVWEWEERQGLWIPYQADVVEYLEEKYLRLKQRVSKESTVSLGKHFFGLLSYEVDLVNMEQQRTETGRLRKVRRNVYQSNSVPGCGIRWEWYNDIVWVAYDIPTSEVIEQAYKSNMPTLDLSHTPVAIPNYVYFRGHIIKQVNKHTHFEREVKRLTHQKYPKDTLALKTTGASTNSRGNTLTSMNGRSASKLTTPSKSTVSSTRQSVKTSGTVKRMKKMKVEDSQDVGATAADPLSEFCNDLATAPDEDCAICFEKLCNVSSFDDETEDSGKAQSSNIKELSQCKHAFHASCLQAMYDSGPKDGSLQCPTCKAIHGIKHGNQPEDGVMDVTYSQRSLPGHADCGMITIIYDFCSGIQGPEHPNPGKTYSARGFPRTCYLPDNEKGKKVLKLLRKAWKRRLIFTIGTSSTTGEDGTVVWNEIHHKTEPFSNHMGHGFPDPNYLDNVLAELAAQGVKDDVEVTVI